MGQTFVSREKQLARMDRLLEAAIQGKGQVCFVTGEAGLGKTSLTTEFARRAQQGNQDLLVAIGDCNSQTGISDPYLPFREVLAMLTGDIDDRVAQGMTTEENAGRLREFLRVTKRIVMEVGPDLIDIFVPGIGLATKAGVLVAGDEDMLWRKKQPPAAATSSSVQNLQESEQGRIFEQVTRVLLALVGQRPLILILDDLHWIDDSSASLLFHLARRIEGSRILIIGTYRPEEIALGRGEYRHPMAQIVPELKRYYGDLMIALGEEDEDEGRQFIDALVDTQANVLGREFRNRLFEHTRGHPLFAIELLRDLQERGALKKDENDSWLLGPDLDWDQLPARTEGVIEERVNRLPDHLQEILSMASVHGEEFTAQVIQPLTGLNERQLLAALTRELGHVHRLVVEEGTDRVGNNRLSRFRFRHQLFQKYFYERLGASERELLHETVACTLESLHGDANETHRVAVDLAHHFERARLLDRAAHFCLQAGQGALRVYAYHEAAAFARRGLDCLELGNYAGSHCGLLLELMLLEGEAQQDRGNVSEAMETFCRTADLALEAGASEAAARAAMGYCEPALRYNLVDSTSQRLVTEALALLGSEDSALRARLTAYLARTSGKVKSPEELMAILEEATSMARRLGDPRALIDCARFRFSLDRDPGRIGERLELADEMVELGKKAGNKGLLLEMLMYRICDRLAIGDLESCERDQDSMRSLAGELGDPFYIYQSESIRASGALLTGRFDEAERLTMGAMETGQRLEVGNVEGAMGVQMFTIRREQGRLGEIAPMVSHFVEDRGVGMAWRPGLSLVYAEIGDTERAGEQFERMAGTEFKCVPKDALWQTCLSYLAEVCDFLHDRKRAEILYDLLLPYSTLNVVVGNAIACLGAGSRFLGLLATVMERWDEAEKHFQHATEFNRRQGANPWLAHTQYEFARMLRKRGREQDIETARGLIGEAGKTVKALGMQGLAAKINAMTRDGQT